MFRLTPLGRTPSHNKTNNGGGKLALSQVLYDQIQRLTKVDELSIYFDEVNDGVVEITRKSPGVVSPDVSVNNNDEKLPIQKPTSSKVGPPETIVVVAIEPNPQKGFTLRDFNEKISNLKLLLSLSGLSQKTSTLYRYWLRVVVWTCTVLCIINLFRKTRSYRSILFDIALSTMHLWVSLAYESWNSFLKTKHWQHLLLSQSYDDFLKRLSLIGTIGCIAVAGKNCA